MRQFPGGTLLGAVTSRDPCEFPAGGRRIETWVVSSWYSSTWIKPLPARPVCAAPGSGYPAYGGHRLDKSSFTREDLIAAGHGRLFDATAAKFPLDPMRMVDRITHVDSSGGRYGRGILTAELDIHPALWFFACHFEDDPVMPGCLGLDALWQLLGFFLAWSGHRGRGRALGADPELRNRSRAPRQRALA